MTTAPPTFELSALTQDEWHALRVYQDLYQLLLTLVHRERSAADSAEGEADGEAHGEGEGEVDEGLEGELRAPGALDAELKEEALAQLSGAPRQLLELTFDELIQQLLDAHWIRRVDERLALSRPFSRRVHLLLDGRDPFESPKKTRADKPKEGPRRAGPDLEYVDLFAHVSEEDDSLFTARHLERVIATLDGLTLLLSGLYELISFSDDERFPELIEAMSRAQLLKREGQFVKLDLQGGLIARESRPERLKQLGVIAERMRRDAQRRG